MQGLEPKDRSFHVGQHSEVITHQGGLLGVRVGEASHPGPRVREMHRRRVASSSDDEPLVRPIVGRDVIPRREAGSVVIVTRREASHNTYVALRDVEFGVHLGEEFDLTVADSPDEAPTISEATVPESVLDTLEADLIPPMQSTVPASVDVAATAILSASTVPASSRALCAVHGGSPSTDVDHSARCREFPRF